MSRPAPQSRKALIRRKLWHRARPRGHGNLRARRSRGDSTRRPGDLRRRREAGPTRAPAIVPRRGAHGGRAACRAARLGVGQPVEDAGRIVLQDGELPFHDDGLEAVLDRASSPAPRPPRPGPAGRQNEQCGGTAVNRKRFCLSPMSSGMMKPWTFTDLRSRREDVLRELGHHLAALLHRLDLRQRPPRHDARLLGQQRGAVVAGARATRRRNAGRYAPTSAGDSERGSDKRERGSGASIHPRRAWPRHRVGTRATPATRQRLYRRPAPARRPTVPRRATSPHRPPAAQRRATGRPARRDRVRRGEPEHQRRCGEAAGFRSAGRPRSARATRPARA